MTATDRELPAWDLLMLVNGSRTAARSGRTYESTDPFTGQPWAQVPDAAALRAGTVWINAYRVVSPLVPFGGFGDSGMGRENGADAIREYTETKSVWVELTGATRDPFTLG